MELIYILEKYSTNILSAILILITAYYAWQTRIMVKEMEVTRKYQFVPSLKVKPIKLSSGDQFDVEIINIGLGPAKNIKGKLKLEPYGEEIDIVYHILHPGDRFVLNTPFINAKNFSDVKKFKILKLSVYFEDMVNTTHESIDLCNLDDFEKTKNCYYTNETVDELNNIQRELYGIRSAIENKK